MQAPTRREALLTIAAASAACSGNESQPSGPLSQAEVARLEALADTIIPATSTPGAAEAGVAVMIAEDAAEDPELLAGVRALLDRADGFEDLSTDERVRWMTDLMNDEGEGAAQFELLKGLAIDAYYATEVGLVDELGYQGNTYLAEFPGCTHEHIPTGAEEQA